MHLHYICFELLNYLARTHTLTLLCYPFVSSIKEHNVESVKPSKMRFVGRRSLAEAQAFAHVCHSWKQTLPSLKLSFDKQSADNFQAKAH